MGLAATPRIGIFTQFYASSRVAGIQGQAKLSSRVSGRGDQRPVSANASASLLADAAHQCNFALPRGHFSPTGTSHSHIGSCWECEHTDQTAPCDPRLRIVALPARPHRHLSTGIALLRGVQITSHGIRVAARCERPARLAACAPHSPPDTLAPKAAHNSYLMQRCGVLQLHALPHGISFEIGSREGPARRAFAPSASAGCSAASQTDPVRTQGWSPAGAYGAARWRRGRWWAAANERGRTG